MQGSPTRRLAVLTVLSATLATLSVRAAQAPNQPPRPATRQPPPSRIQVPTTKMPNLVGMQLDKARDQPVVVRFKLALNPENVESSQHLPGTIVRQSVPAGDPVRAGASIVVYVSTGGLQVPSVEGQPVDVARSILQKAGFRAEVSTVVTPQFRPGIVRRQDPKPGTVRPRNSIVIIEAAVAPDAPRPQPQPPQPPRPQPQPPQPPRPQPNYVMPDLVGRTADDAMANEVVRQIKLQVTRRDDAAADGRPGLVVRQSIPPGAVVNPGDPVTVWIATGVRVPSVVGLDADAARSQLVAAGLQARAREVRRDRGAGQVVEQSPAANTVVPRGTSVVVSVALAPLVKVPDVARRPREAAERLLNGAGLRSAFSDDDASELDPGVVAAQDPAPDSEVDAGTVVRLRVATGVLVPAVVGSNPDDARARARSSGLAASVTDVRTDAATSGTVFEQKPGAGERVARGTTLQLSVARTPLVAVPNLIQQTRADATNAARAVRLDITFEEDRDSTLPPGQVIRQDPAAGASAEIGTTMRVAVATGVAVPDVSRLPVATARSQLETAGLRADEVREVSTGSPDSTVLRQSPDATAIVARGSAVRLVVAALQTVTVPNVVGRTRSEVERLLTSIRLGLAFQVAAAPDGTGPAGTIVRQDPVAGANVAADTVLRVFIVAPVVQPRSTLVDWLRALNLIATFPALLGIGLLGLVAYRFVKANRGSLKKKPDGGAAPPTSDVVLDSHPGDVTTRLEVSGEGLIDFEVRLRVDNCGGQQSLTVDGPLLENEKRVYE